VERMWKVLGFVQWTTNIGRSEQKRIEAIQEGLCKRADDRTYLILHVTELCMPDPVPGIEASNLLQCEVSKPSTRRQYDVEAVETVKRAKGFYPD
jgi:hypothetical protein